MKNSKMSLFDPKTDIPDPAPTSPRSGSPKQPPIPVKIKARTLPGPNLPQNHPKSASKRVILRVGSVFAKSGKNDKNGGNGKSEKVVEK